jgi:serine/threonine protein kinase
MLDQSRYNSIQTLRSELIEQSVLVDCPQEPQGTAILHSYETKLPTQSILNLVSSQIDRLLTLRHPHLQALIDVFIENDSLHIVQEVVEGKTAVTLVPLSAEAGERLLEELLQVIIYLHDRDITHGNISPETIVRDRHRGSILTDFQTIKDLVSATRGEESRANILTRLSKVQIPKTNIPKGKQFDLYSLGLTLIYLLTDRDLEHIFNSYTQQWQWEQYTNCPDRLVKIIARLISSESITAREILNQLQSRSQNFVSLPLPSKQPSEFDPDSIESTFIDLPKDLNAPIYLQAGILGFLVGVIWIILHSLLPWGALYSGIIGMTIGGAIYWQYRSPYLTNQLYIITAIVSILILLIPAFRQKLPVFTNLNNPGLFEVSLFLLGCGVFNFAVFILAGFIYRYLFALIDKNVK